MQPPQARARYLVRIPLLTGRGKKQQTTYSYYAGEQFKTAVGPGSNGKTEHLWTPHRGEALSLRRRSAAGLAASLPSAELEPVDVEV